MIRPAALLASLGLHGLLWWYLAAQPLPAGGAPEPARQFSRISLQFAPAPAEPVAEPEPAPEPDPEPEPEPPPPPKPKPKPEPETQKPERPKPKPPERQAQPPPRPAAAAQATAPVQAARPEAAPGLDPQVEQAYLDGLLAHIERHKQYPRAANRRRIEGRVEVRFTLLRGGRIEGLSSEGGHRLLRQAAEAAVREALPLPAPPRGFELPFAVSYGMEFRLR